jgi:prevent-host-death family protein
LSAHQPGGGHVAQQSHNGKEFEIGHYALFSRVHKRATAVSAADANRRFSELLRTVKRGRSVIVTSHGKPVAKISPLAEDERAAAGARSVLFARLRRERAMNAGRWTRDELYDDAP